MRESHDLTAIFVSLRASLARAVQQIVPPREIEDIVQETYVRVCKETSANEIRSPRSFMLKTARNLALDYVKRAEYRLADNLEGNEPGIGSGTSANADGTLDQVCADQEFSQFCDAVRYLPAQTRRAFVLKKVYGYSQREIAKLMKISEKTVEKHIASGVKRCMYYLSKQGLDFSDSTANEDLVRNNRSSGSPRT